MRIEKTVFISYRRTNVAWALAIFKDLTSHGYDVFFDFTGLASGDFEQAIMEHIRARAHFLVLLPRLRSKGAAGPMTGFDAKSRPPWRCGAISWR